jgi:hypothetical protein
VQIEIESFNASRRCGRAANPSEPSAEHCEWAMRAHAAAPAKRSSGTDPLRSFAASVRSIETA